MQIWIPCILDMIWGIAQFKMIMNVKESIHRFVLESSRSKDVMSVFKTPKWFFLLTDVLQCCNIPSLAKILSRPGGGIQSHLSLNILCHSNPNVTHCAEDRWWKPQKYHTQNSQNIPKLCCCPDCSNLYLIPMEHLPEASGHHLMHNRVASSQQHHLPQGDHPPTMLERSRRYAYSTHEHDLCISFLWVSLVSFSGWVLLWHLNISRWCIYDWDILYMIIVGYIMCVFKTMFAKSLSITSHVLWSCFISFCGKEHQPKLPNNLRFPKWCMG